MKVLVFCNSGSGKSTYARALAAQEGLVHLDLDSIVWEPGKIAVQRSTESVIADLQSFMDSHPTWVIEGCYGELIQAAAVRCSLLVFLNPGIEAVSRKQCQAPLGATKVLFARATRCHAHYPARAGGRILRSRRCMVIPSASRNLRCLRGTKD